jgi:pilus assembly protein Flp/PilA
MLKKLLSIKSQKGVTMIEYALIASLVAVAAITMLTGLGSQIGAVFTNITTQLTPTTTTGQ